MPIKNRLAELHGDIAAWRRDIHTHPELRFEEPRTVAFVAEKLWGFGGDDVVEGIGGTGVVGVIRGEATALTFTTPNTTSTIRLSRLDAVGSPKWSKPACPPRDRGKEHSDACRKPFCGIA